VKEASLEVKSPHSSGGFFIAGRCLVIIATSFAMFHSASMKSPHDPKKSGILYSFNAGFGQ